MTLFGKILLTLILVTGTVLLIKGGSKEDLQTSGEEAAQEETVAKEETVDENVFSGSLKDLITRGGNYKCEFTHSSDVADSSGTIFIAGEKIRGNFVSLAKPANAKVESYMITDGGFSYVWSSMMPMGMKIKIDMQNLPEVQNPTAGSFDYNQNLDYSCEPWTIDESVFTVPQDIKFTELPS